MSENMEEFEGIEVEFLIQQDTLMVVAAIPGGPSDKAGIRAGDRIVAVEGEPFRAPSLTTAGSMAAQGPRGTEVNLGIDRRGEPFQVRHPRPNPIPASSASFMLEEVGCQGHSPPTPPSSARWAAWPPERHVSGGGLAGQRRGCLNAVVDMLDLILDEGQAMVYTEGKCPPAELPHAATLRRRPVVVW